MKTLGLEMIDAGFEVAVGCSSPSGDQTTAERLDPPGTVPAVVLWDGNSMHVGAAAEARRFLYPRQMSEVFWEELSLAPSTLRQSGRVLTYSELSYHFVRNLVEGLPGAAGEHESIVLAVPSAALDSGERGEERVGILLGICHDLELKLSSIVDASCAAMLDPEVVPPSRGTVLVIDLGLQAATLTLVDLGATISRQATSRIAGAGWLAMVDAARRALADRFLRQTSFDVSADRHTEQAFHLETLSALRAFTTQPESWLRLVSGARERSISVPRDGFIADMRSFSDAIAQGAKEMLLRLGTNLADVQVYLTARARHVCGLGKALRSNGAIDVGILTAGAAARGAAVLACQRKPPASLEDVPVEIAITPPEFTHDPLTALRTAFAFSRQAGAREAGPTHVVFDGNAYPLRPNGLRVAVGGASGDCDVALETIPAGVGPCELVVESSDGVWNVAAIIGGRRASLPGGEPAVAPGDVLEVHGSPGTTRLLFIRLVS
jgi:hypothetical protein